MILILLLAFAVRLPGIFWGFRTAPKPHFFEYHPDEPVYAGISKKMLSLTSEPGKNQPPEDHFQEESLKGISFQMALVSYILKPVIGIHSSTLTLIGRSLSVMYGVLTVGLVYFFSNEIFKNNTIALFSSLLLALSGLHVTQSHQAVPDSATIFWWYAVMCFSLFYCRCNKNKYLALASLSAGMALATKLSFLCLIPVIYVLIKKRLNPIYWLLVLGGAFIIFVVAQGGHYNFHNFMLTLDNVRTDNINIVNVKNNKLWNPLIYLAGMPPALGLANLVLLLIGIFIFRRKLTREIIHKDYFFILVLPLALQVVVFCSMDITTSRHFLPLVPFLMMIAAYALNEMRMNIARRWSILLLSAVILYQLIYVAGIEYYFIVDPRDKAEQWILDNIPQGKSIHLTTYTDMLDFGKRYRIVQDYNADYLVLHERYYLGYTRYKLHPIKHPYPAFEQIIYGKRMDFDQIQDIFKGKSSFKLIKSFLMPGITPENYFYKKFWGEYYSYIGDTLVFKNSKAP